MDIIKWGSISFYVNSTAIRGIKNLSFSASCETEDTTEGEEKYVKRKNANPYEFSMTAILMAALGENVQATALLLTEAARKGTSGYMYCGTSKLFPFNLMATSASVSNIQISVKGEWIYAEVNLSLKQSSKYEVPPPPASQQAGSGAGAGVGSNKVSVNTSGIKTTLSLPVQYGIAKLMGQSTTGKAASTYDYLKSQIDNAKTTSAKTQTAKVLSVTTKSIAGPVNKNLSATAYSPANPVPSLSVSNPVVKAVTNNKATTTTKKLSATAKAKVISVVAVKK